MGQTGWRTAGMHTRRNLYEDDHATYHTALKCVCVCVCMWKGIEREGVICVCSAWPDTV